MTQRRRDNRRWAPGVGWISEAQQRALGAIFELARTSSVNGEGDGTGWVRWGDLATRVLERTLRVLERHRLVEIAIGDLVRLTATGARLACSWQEADAQ